MTATTLPRMKFKDVDASLVDSRVQLAKDAQTILGYGKLARAIAAPDALLFQLRRLAISPLYLPAVLDYKRKKEHVGLRGYWPPLRELPYSLWVLLSQKRGAQATARYANGKLGS